MTRLTSTPTANNLSETSSPALPNRLPTSHRLPTVTRDGVKLGNSAARGRERRGATTVLGLFLASSLVIIMAMTLDLGNISVSRSELRRSADAAALAACWQLFDSRVAGVGNSQTQFAVEDAAEMLAAFNRIADQSPMLARGSEDVQLGYWDPTAPNSFDTTGSAQFNAVKVTLRREQAINGEVPLFFSQALGRDSQALRAESTAAMFQNIKGFYLPPNSESSLDLLPIALDLQTWQAVCASATEDKFALVNGNLVSGCDGFFECNLYPQGTGSPGNRGTVDIGGSNNSTADISRQVLSGISDQDLLDFGRPLELDATGRILLNGDTGISAGIKDELASIIGEKRIIPIFESVSGNGNNAMYSIVAFEGVRILEVKLTGPMKKKRVIIQPAPMLARGGVIDNSGQVTSQYLYTPVMLVK
ncbi:TadG family pilus assembly protein [Planctomycetaceae bacterium SH139]